MARHYISAAPSKPKEHAVLRRSPTVAELTRPSGSVESHLYDAATEALANAGVSGALAMAATPVSSLVARMRPLLRGGGRGLLAARVGGRDGLYVGREAVRRLGRPEDLEALARFDAATGARPWKEMTRAEKLALVRDTGFQQTPTGETVRQIPKLEYAKDAWRDFEPFVGRWRSAVADAAWRRFPETEMRFADRVAGPGAEELFAYYPELADARVSTVLSGPYVAAADDGTVYLTKEAFREGVKPLTEAMHHEPQHLVQRASGMAPGSSPERAGLGYLGNRGGVAENAHFDGARFAEADNYRRLDLAIANSIGSRDPAMFRYRHAGGEAGAYAVGRTATEGPTVLLEDAMRAGGIDPELVYDNRLADAVADAGDREIMERQLTKMDLAETRRASKGGDNRFRNSRNFLATDKVPDTIFGVPVAKAEGEWTEEDLEFFRKHPEAGGYYSMGDEGQEEPAPEEQTQGAVKAGDVDELSTRLNAAISQAIPFIKQHEGFRPTAYRDSVGKWTVGYGQTTIDGRDVVEGDTIDEKTAAKFVEKRVRDNAIHMYRNMPWTNGASANGLSALYDLAYNIGVNRLGEKSSPTLNRTGKAAVGQDAVDQAIWDQVPTYVKAGGKVLQGLVNRRNDAIKEWKK